MFRLRWPRTPLRLPPRVRLRLRVLRFGLRDGIEESWNRWFGDRGERVAARYLRRKGMRILTRGFRTAQGEIDLIARDGDTLVFVEVKIRRRGVPAEAVTPEKQRRIARAAHQFLRRYRLLDRRRAVPCRFDVVAILWPDHRLGSPTVDHVPDAFEDPDPSGPPRH